MIGKCRLGVRYRLNQSYALNLFHIWTTYSFRSMVKVSKKFSIPEPDIPKNTLPIFIVRYEKCNSVPKTLINIC